MLTKKILIIQTGQAVSSALQLYGDFPLWFQKSMQLDASQVRVVRVDLGEPLPQPNEVAAAVITGSAAMVTDQPQWLLNTQRWLDSVLKKDKPILGVCYGHQLLVDMLGGRVDYNPVGRSIGSVPICFNQAAASDALFSSEENACKLNQKTVSEVECQHRVFVSHSQVAITLPQDAVQLAYTSRDQNHAFRYADSLWGLQFHPEWNAQITACYIKQRSKDLYAEGLKPEMLLNELKNHKHSGDVWLQKFAALALQHM